MTKDFIHIRFLVAAYMRGQFYGRIDLKGNAWGIQVQQAAEEFFYPAEQFAFWKGVQVARWG